jgi:hypothetical protein
MRKEGHDEPKDGFAFIVGDGLIRHRTEPRSR